MEMPQNSLTIKNKSTYCVNLATCNDGKISQVYNQLKPGSVIHIESEQQGWKDIIVMAAHEENTISKDSDWFDVVSMSIDTAERFPQPQASFKRAILRKGTEALFASIQ